MASNKEAMIAKYGSLEAYRAYLKEWGSRGGKAKVSKGPNKYKKANKSV